MPQAVELATDYYRNNFLHLLNFVAERYWHLLPTAERGFYQRFKGLPPPAQQLYIRLLSRRGNDFRLRKLHYEEIGDLADAAAALVQRELMSIDPTIALEDLLPLFTKLELVDALQSLKPAPRKHQPRTELVAQILAGTADAQQQVSQRLRRHETLLQPQDTHLFTCFQLCFFGNLRQDLTDYVLRDLGLQRYESYRLDAAQAPFSNQRQLTQHLHYYALLETLTDDVRKDAAALVQLWRELPSPEPADITLERRVGRTTNTLARQLERLGANDEALMLYQSSQRPPARERRARLLQKRGDSEACLALCRTIASAPCNEEERVFGETFGARQACKQGLDWPQPTRYAPPEDHIVLPLEQSSVERAAAQHYGVHGSCYYVENNLINGMLGLFVWDILFAPVRGAFFNPFQNAPADFREHSFFARRQALFEQRFTELGDAPAMRQRIMANWQLKFGMANPLVHWERLSSELLETALIRIPETHWRSLFQRILDDPQHNRSGLPDLILFPAQGDYQLIEIKAPGDRLQKNQQRWMQFFARNDIPHRVSHISWQPL